MYEPVFTKEFQRCVKRYKSIAKLIQKEVDSILQAPYHHSELLAKKKRDWRGWRSKRVTRSFRIVYALAFSFSSLPDSSFPSPSTCSGRSCPAPGVMAHANILSRCQLSKDLKTVPEVF